MLAGRRPRKKFKPGISLSALREGNFRREREAPKKAPRSMQPSARCAMGKPRMKRGPSVLLWWRKKEGTKGAQSQPGHLPRRFGTLSTVPCLDLMREHSNRTRFTP